MLEILYHSVNIVYHIHRIFYRKCVHDIMYDIVRQDYYIVGQPNILYVNIRYRRVPRIQMFNDSLWLQSLQLFV